MSKTGRNEPCPCGSGKKYKRCCMGRAVSPGLVLTPKEDSELPDAGPVTQEMKDATDKMLAEEGYTAEAARALFDLERRRDRATRTRRVRAAAVFASAVAWAGAQKGQRE